MQEIKDIFESFSTRLKAPYFGYTFFASFALNWQHYLILLGGEGTLNTRVEQFDATTNELWLFWFPLGLGAILALVSPWVRWGFAKLVSYPTTGRLTVQAAADQKLVHAKADLEAAYARITSERERALIDEAKRDLEIQSIENKEIKDELEANIKKGRSDSSVVVGKPFKTLPTGSNHPMQGEDFEAMISFHREKPQYVVITNNMDDVAADVSVQLEVLGSDLPSQLIEIGSLDPLQRKRYELNVLEEELVANGLGTLSEFDILNVLIDYIHYDGKRLYWQEGLDLQKPKTKSRQQD